MREAEANLQALIQSSTTNYNLSEKLPLTSFPDFPHSPEHVTDESQNTMDTQPTLFQFSTSTYNIEQSQGLELRGIEPSLVHLSQADAFNEIMSSEQYSQSATSSTYSQAGNIDSLASDVTMKSSPSVQEMTSAASGLLTGIMSFSHSHVTDLDTATSSTSGTLPGMSSFTSLQPVTFPVTTLTPSGQQMTSTQQQTTSPQQHTTSFSHAQDVGSVTNVRPRRNVPSVVSMDSPCRDPKRDELQKLEHRQLKAFLRKERNKEAARRSNLNKKMERERLEKQSVELWEENLQLHQDIRLLTQKLHRFRYQRHIMQHVCPNPGPMAACR